MLILGCVISIEFRGFSSRYRLAVVVKVCVHVYRERKRVFKLEIDDCSMRPRYVRSDCKRFRGQSKARTSSKNIGPPCAKVCNLCPLPTKVHSCTLAVERHNVFLTADVSKESPEYIASRWMLSCFSRLLCISIAIRVTKDGKQDAE
jgi:hypothetical protein